MHLPSRTTAATIVTSTVATLTLFILAPLSTTVRWATSLRVHREEDGLSEVVSGLLLAGGIALIVIAVLAIIQPWAEGEANNLPTSGD